MKLEILTDNFKKALGNIERITKKTLTLPILQNALLKAEKNFLKIISTDLEVGMTWHILAKIEQEGEVVVPASILSSLVSLIKDEKIILRTENKNLVLEAQNQNTQIQGIDSKEYPIIPTIQSEDAVIISGQKINQGLAQVLDIPSVSQIRPEISGVYFSLGKNEIKIVGTDSFRLAEKTIPLEQKLKKETSFILPQTAARELVNILNQETNDLKISSDGKQVLFEWLDKEATQSNIRLFSRLIEGEYPSYQDIIPKKSASKIILSKDEFLLQIKKAGLFSGKISEVKITPLVPEQRIKIFAQSPEIGKNEAQLAAKIGGGENTKETSFNYRFLIDGLNNIRSSEVLLELSEEEGPGVLKPIGDESYIYVLMPIKSS